jgi:hypothetical protein
LLNLVNEFAGQGGGLTFAYIATDVNLRWKTFVTQYDGDTAEVRAAIGGSTDQLAAWQQALTAPPNWVAGALQQTVITMINDYFPLTAKTIAAALTQLIVQMKADSKTVKANVATISPAAGGGNVGNGKLICSLVDGNGLQMEYVYAEILPLTFTNTATAGAEQASIAGTVAAPGLLATNWPLGSGSTTRITSLDAANSGTNKISNGALETFTVANTPDGFAIDVGAAGTDVFSEASIVYKGAKALKILGDGATAVALSQSITPSTLKPLTPYAIHFWGRISTAPAAGVLTVDLYDGSSVINDEAGTANAFTVDLTTLGTSYVAKNGVFRLPDPLPAVIQLRLRTTTALSTGKSVYLDQLTLQEMTRLYVGGPYVALASGKINWINEDLWNITVTNTYAGQLQTAFWRLFNMPQLGLILASKTDASENILDSNIA